MENINLGRGDGLPPVDWSAVEATLAAGTGPDPESPNSRSTWLTTLNADGSPHTTAVGAIWLDGAFWFQTGSTRKAANVARDPRCTLAVSIRDSDVVVEGDAVRVTDAAGIARAATGWAETGWPAEPDPSGKGITAPYNAPGQGPAPWSVFRIEARSATVVSNVEPGGAGRIRF